MNETLLNELERLHRQATPGEWGDNPDSGFVHAGQNIKRTPLLFQTWDRYENDFPNAAQNRAFIIAAHNNLLDLLAAARKGLEGERELTTAKDERDTARKENARLRESLRSIQKSLQWHEPSRQVGSWDECLGPFIEKALAECDAVLASTASPSPTPTGPSDGAMLDWLEANARPITIYDGSEDGRDVYNCSDHDDLRAAITAAMAGKEGA